MVRCVAIAVCDTQATRNERGKITTHPELSRRRFLQLTAGAAAVTVVPMPGASAATRGSVCDPLGTPPSFMGSVPKPEDVLGFPLGVDRETTAAEIVGYMNAVGAASNRVMVDTLGSSHQGRPIRYAIVGRPSNVSTAALNQIRQDTGSIRDPNTPQTAVDALASTTPAILWIASSIHGDEESGADAALQLLFELADRDDCGVTDILDRAIVVIVPCQNPDGREHDLRRNAYGFDLNQDHAARTQPETDGKIELMRRYPPLVLTDHHEFGYYRSFFPPNDDPVYHETPEQAVRSINDVFAPAFARTFRGEGWKYFNRGYGYDLFAPRFTDTLAIMGFGSVGMTLEHYNGAPLDVRYTKHLTEMWLTLATAARHKRKLLRGLHREYVDALAEGRRGQLEPNRTYEPGSRSRVRVPHRRLRHYFFPDDPARRRETRMLMRRLQRMDVDVYRLNRPLVVPDFRPYLDDPHRRVVPAGTFWVPMAQPQKRWIQAVLNEDPFNPTAAAYRVSSWSLPLSYNLDGGMSGAVLRPDADPVGPIHDPGPPALPSKIPAIGILHMSRDFTQFESVRNARWLFDTQWGTPYSLLGPEDVDAGALQGLDVLLLPAGGLNEGLRKLGSAGQRAIVRWVNDGGRFVGWRYGGARLAYALGISRAFYDFVPGDIDGPLVRVVLDHRSPLADGVGRFAWILADTRAMRAPDRFSPVRFPTRESGEFRVSGIRRGTHWLWGTTAVADEPVGRGRSIVFSFEPNYAGGMVGTQKILLNAIFGPNPQGYGRSASARFRPEVVASRLAETRDWIDRPEPAAH